VYEITHGTSALGRLVKGLRKAFLLLGEKPVRGGEAIAECSGLIQAKAQGRQGEHHDGRAGVLHVAMTVESVAALVHLA
jgi:hypothetical protein